MDKDLIIDVGSSEVSIALLENHRLIELNKEPIDGNYSVGDVYLGRVKRIMPALNAAFVDIGDEKDAFIHYLDLGLSFKSLDYFTRNIGQNKKSYKDFFSTLKVNDILEKEGKIADILKVGHHGSRTSTSVEFLERVNPKIAVICVGEGNRYGHPSDIVLERLDSSGVTVYRTDWHGTIVIETDGAEIRVTTEK